MLNYSFRLIGTESLETRQLVITIIFYDLPHLKTWIFVTVVLKMSAFHSGTIGFTGFNFLYRLCELPNEDSLCLRDLI